MNTLTPGTESVAAAAVSYLPAIAAISLFAYIGIKAVRKGLKEIGVLSKA